MSATMDSTGNEMAEGLSSLGIHTKTMMQLQKKTSVIWELKLIDKLVEQNDLNTPSCLVEIGGGILLRFVFQRLNNQNEGQKHTLALFVQLKSRGEDLDRKNYYSNIGFFTQINLLNEAGDILHSSEDKYISFPLDNLQSLVWVRDYHLEDNDPFNLSKTEDERHYILQLNLTHSEIISSDVTPAPVKTTFQDRFIQKIKDGFYSERRFPDLTLITSEGIRHATHKFILASVSPAFRKLIEEESDKDGFNEEITLNDLNAKPLVSILHWIYSGELLEEAGKCMRELVDAAYKYELTDLLIILDKKLISVCNKENMFCLFKVAEGYCMHTAIKDISSFIKKNLPE